MFPGSTKSRKNIKKRYIEQYEDTNQQNTEEQANSEEAGWNLSRMGQLISNPT